MTRKKQEERELCADLVKVQWENASGALQSEWAILSDISASGACLEVEIPIEPGTLVALEMASERCQARAKYCRFDKVNYLLGVEFEDGYRWSRRRFKPEHLTQFRLRKVKTED